MSMFSDINEATINVLTRNGNDVSIPKKSNLLWCLTCPCRRQRDGKKAGKAKYRAFEGAEKIIVNAAGCGCMMKEYSELFRDEPEWRARAEKFENKVEDISKYLHDTGFDKAKNKG